MYNLILFVDFMNFKANLLKKLLILCLIFGKNLCLVQDDHLLGEKSQNSKDVKPYSVRSLLPIGAAAGSLLAIWWWRQPIKNFFQNNDSDQKLIGEKEPTLLKTEKTVFDDQKSPSEIKNTSSKSEEVLKEEKDFSLWNENVSKLVREAGLDFSSQLSKFGGTNPARAVERTGSVFVTKIDGEWYFVMGLDGIENLYTQGKPNSLCFPAGGVDLKPEKRTVKNLLKTIVRETCEESGGFINLDEKELNKYPCIIDKNNDFFSTDRKMLSVVALKPDVLSRLNDACQKANNDTSLPFCQREVYGYTLVKVSDFEKPVSKMIPKSDGTVKKITMCKITTDLAQGQKEFSYTGAKSKISGQKVSLKNQMLVPCEEFYFNCVFWQMKDVKKILSLYEQGLDI